MSKINSILVAKILIFTSFILLVWSVVIYTEENNVSVDPKKSISLNPNQEEIKITNKGDTNNIEPFSNEQANNENTDDFVNIPNNNTPITEENGNNTVEVPVPNEDNSNFNVAPVVPEEVKPSLSDINNNLRNTIQNNYGITILYGNETFNYKVGGLTTYVETNENNINNALNSLANIMELYPYGFFQEIKNGGIPLTLYLIQSYSEAGVTGATNAFNNRADISIALQYDFADSFNHEVLHYIEKFIKKKGDNFNSWSTLNPFNFKYGSVNSTLSYNKTFSADAPFVNNYAQTSAEEDRASTFEYMMTQTKASCLNMEKTVWRKADFLAQKIDLAFNTVSPNILEYWERFIY